LTPVAVRELTSRRLSADVVPSRLEAAQELGESFAEHLIVNVS